MTDGFQPKKAEPGRESPLVARSCLVVCFAVAISLACTGRRRGDQGTNDTENPEDTESSTENDTETETETGSETESESDQTGWTWVPSPLGTMGSFSDVAGRSPDDVVATGEFLFLEDLSFYPFLGFDGSFFNLGTAMLGTELDGTGVCVSQNLDYVLGAMTTDWPESQPRFFVAETTVWNEVVGLPDLCSSGTWLPYFAETLYGRHITCLEPEGFAALLLCDFPPPDENVVFLASYDGQDWTATPLFSDFGDVSPNAALWGSVIDDILVFTNDSQSPSYHFDGIALTATTPPPGTWFFSSDGGVKAMAGSRASQGAELGYWVTGAYFDENLDPGRYRGFVWRSPDGMAWTDIDVPHPTDPSACDEYFHDLWISDQDEVFVVGGRICVAQNEDGSEVLPVFLRYNGAEWEEIEVPQHPLFDGEARGDLQRIWGTGGVVFVAAVMQLAGHDIPVLLRRQPD